MGRSGRRLYLRRAYGRGEHNAWRRGRWRTEFIGLPRHEIANILYYSGFTELDVKFIRRVQPSESKFMPVTMLFRDTGIILMNRWLVRAPVVFGLIWVSQTEMKDFGLYLALVLTLICGVMGYTVHALVNASPGYLTQVGAESITRMGMRIRKRVDWPFDRLALRQLGRRLYPEIVEAERMRVQASLCWVVVFLFTAVAWLRLLAPLLGLG